MEKSGYILKINNYSIFFSIGSAYKIRRAKHSTACTAAKINPYGQLQRSKSAFSEPGQLLRISMELCISDSFLTTVNNGVHLAVHEELFCWQYGWHFPESFSVSSFRMKFIVYLQVYRHGVFSLKTYHVLFSLLNKGWQCHVNILLPNITLNYIDGLTQDGWLSSLYTLVNLLSLFR